MKFTQHNCYFAMSIWKCMAYFVKKKKAIQFPEDVTKSEEIIFISQVKKSHSKYSCQ